MRGSIVGMCNAVQADVHPHVQESHMHDAGKCARRLLTASRRRRARETIWRPRGCSGRTASRLSRAGMDHKLAWQPPCMHSHLTRNVTHSHPQYSSPTSKMCDTGEIAGGYRAKKRGMAVKGWLAAARNVQPPRMATHWCACERAALPMCPFRFKHKFTPLVGGCAGRGATSNELTLQIALRISRTGRSFTAVEAPFESSH